MNCDETTGSPTNQKENIEREQTRRIEVKPAEAKPIETQQDEPRRIGTKYAGTSLMEIKRDGTSRNTCLWLGISISGPKSLNANI